LQFFSNRNIFPAAGNKFPWLHQQLEHRNELVAENGSLRARTQEAWNSFDFCIECRLARLLSWLLLDILDWSSHCYGGSKSKNTDDYPFSFLTLSVFSLDACSVITSSKLKWRELSTTFWLVL
jgi:hypothetical protein